jgi:8-oxo-dGTP pyrophosphatase MutT (NUDIX family)
MGGRKKQRPPFAAGVILLDGEGRVLLELRNRDDTWYPNCWGITGGAAEAGESPEETARREVLEETGLSLDGGLQPFKVYDYTSHDGSPRQAHLYFAEVSTSLEELTPEGQELRYFSPNELAALSMAFNDGDILAEFFASPEYASRWPQSDDAVAAFSRAIEDGEDWFEALLTAIARWKARDETVAGREYRYLIGGEAFDWLLLAERLLEEADGAVPPSEREALLFSGRPPRELDAEDLKRALGGAKHRAHLNYLYGVTIEEALQLATEEDVLKEQRSKVWQQCEFVEGLVFDRIYGKPHDELLAAFRQERALEAAERLSYGDLKEFTYWLFKYRLRQCDPARVASDTRKALAQLSQLEGAARRRRQRLVIEAEAAVAIEA